MPYSQTAYFHLPGLFEFFDFYKVFLAEYSEHREYFYDNALIGSIYGSPADCIWGGGRFGEGSTPAVEVLELMRKYGISSRLAFSNSLLREEHLADRKCNALCGLFGEYSDIKNGVIVHSDLLLEYLKTQYPQLYFVSSTTKVITDFEDFSAELNREDFRFAVPDFRLNNQLEKLKTLTQSEKDKTEFLCNECCWTGCSNRKTCYENVSRRILGEEYSEHICTSPYGSEGYKFSRAMQSPAFIGRDEIENTYLPLGFSNFKIEGRGLGTAVLLEFLLYYMAKPKYQINVREDIYLDSMLDLI